MAEGSDQPAHAEYLLTTNEVRGRQPMATKTFGTQADLPSVYVEVRKWLINPDYGWDVGITLHLPNAMKAANPCSELELLKDQVGYFLNAMDRRVHGAQHRNNAVRTPRIVAYEDAEGVGWHSHITLATPSSLQIDAFVPTLEQLWWKRVRRYARAPFQKRLFWGEPISGRYASYGIKRIIGNPDAPWINPRGCLDLDKTYLPIL